MFTFDRALILWRERVVEMGKLTFWKKLLPKEDYREMWRMARKSLICVDCLSLLKTNKRWDAKARTSWRKRYKEKAMTEEVVKKPFFDPGDGKGSIYSHITSRAQAEIWLQE